MFFVSFIIIDQSIKENVAAATNNVDDFEFDDDFDVAAVDDAFNDVIVID